MFLTLGWLAVALLGAARLCAMLALGPLGSALATVHLCSSEALVTGAAALAVVHAVSFFALEGGSLDELVGWFADWTAPCGELELELHMYQKRFLDRLAVDKQLTGRVSWVGDDGTVRELEEEAVADPKASEALRLILQAVLDDPEAQQEIFGQVQCRCDAQHHKDGTEAFPFTLSVAQETFLHAKLLPVNNCAETALQVTGTGTLTVQKLLPVQRLRAVGDGAATAESKKGGNFHSVARGKKYSDANKATRCIIDWAMSSAAFGNGGSGGSGGAEANIDDANTALEQAVD